MLSDNTKRFLSTKIPSANDRRDFGACGRTRTGDLRITNALLYQLSHTSSYLLPERVFSRSQCSQYIMLLKVRQYFFEIFLDILRVSVIMV